MTIGPALDPLGADPRQRNPNRLALTIGAMLAGPAFIVAFLATQNMGIALVAAVGLTVGPLLVVNPTVALGVMIAVEISQVGDLVPGAAGLTLPTATTIAAIGAIVVGVRRGTVRLRWSPVFSFALAFLAAEALSVVVARDAGAALGDVGTLARDLAVLPVATLLLASTERFGMAVRLTVGILAGLAILSGVQEFVLHNATTFAGLSKLAAAPTTTSTARHTGPLVDANFWARVLVLAAPLALSLFVVTRARLRRWTWLLAFAGICAGIFLTQSRGGIVALAAGTVVWLLVAGRREARLLFLAPLVVWLLLVNPITGSRLSSLTQLSSASQGGGDPSLVGRAQALQTGLAIFGDHPLLGVGAANYEVVAPDYQRTLGFVKIINVAPHNTYLEMASEAGVLGLAAWLLFVGSAVFVTTRALLLIRRLSSAPRRAPGAWLAVGVIAALVAWSVASLFLHLEQFRTLLVIMALGAALDVAARETATRRLGAAMGAL